MRPQTDSRRPEKRLAATSSLILLSAAFMVGAVAAPSFCSDEPWLAPAFSADAKELLRAATDIRIPEDADLLTLLDERRFVYEADGRKTLTLRTVYRVLTPDGVANGSEISRTWAPWHQRKPQIRARVITRDGTVHTLDPSTLADAQIGREQGEIYTDRHKMHGPLPAVAPGSVVETEIVLSDTEPFFNRGEVVHIVFAQASPVRLMRLIVDAPRSLPLRYKATLVPGLEPQRTESNDRVRLVFERGPLEPSEALPLYLPMDKDSFPAVSFSTGESWHAVASAYAALVEAQIASADKKALLGELVPRTGDRLETIRELAARLHEQVRYTGVEFGEATLVPRTPSEVFQRKYGDCKDKSAVLAAMLRAAGIPAQLALVRTSRFFGPDPALPGMGSFDHVVVYVPATPPLWIDATDEYGRPGTLPAGVQGRLALIVAPETRELMPTPESVSTDNLSSETREFFLADMGPSRVVETSEATGSIDSGYRSYYSRVDPKECREMLSNYTRDAYLSEEAPEFEISDLKDSSRPFRLRLEVEKAALGVTDMTEALAVIPLSGIVSRVPYGLRTEANDKGDKDAPSPRTADWWLDEASVTEWRYLIHPPAGFVLKSLPESGKVQLGPALLSKEFREGSDGTVTAVLRFDTGPRRFSAARGEEMRKGIVALLSEKPPMVTFAHRGNQLLEAGKTREALSEFRAVASAHPGAAVHRVRLARGLLSAGFGEAARVEVRAATLADSKSAVAWETLGWILQHDLLGRRFKKGFDYEGACAAYRKAIELDPKDSETRMNLAILLEHNPEGVRYGAGARLKEAIETYVGIGEELNTSETADNLAIDYLKERRIKECEDYVAKLPLTQARRSVQLSATALGSDAASAVRRAKTEISDAGVRRETLRSAAANLIQMREYALAAEILSSVAQGAENAAEILGQAAIFAKVQRYEDMKLSDEDPKAVLLQFAAKIGSPRVSIRDVIPLFARQTAEDLAGESEERSWQRGLALGAGALLRRAGLPPDVARDLIASSLEVSLDGKPDLGYRMRTQVPGAGVLGMFVVRDDGRYRILYVPFLGAGVGKLVLELVEKGDLEHSREWLDWVREDIPRSGGDDPIAGSPFPRLWERGQAGGRHEIRVAAASLAVGSKRSDEAIRILRDAREQAGDAARREAIDVALAAAYATRAEYDKLLPVAEGLLKSWPTSETAFQLVLLAQNGLKRWSDAAATIEARKMLIPDDLVAARAQAALAEAQGQFDKAVEQLRLLVATNRAVANDWNNLAWDQLFLQPVPDDAVANAQRASTLSQNADAAILHTLSTALAAAGKTAEARGVMLQTMELLDLQEPDAAIWLAFGRIAQECGEKETAIMAYGKVEQDPGPGPHTGSSYELARLWLKSLAAEP